MMHDEYESMSAIHILMPDFASKPMAWRTYKTMPDTHFFLCHFLEMINEMLDPHVHRAVSSAPPKEPVSAKYVWLPCDYLYWKSAPDQSMGNELGDLFYKEYAAGA